MADGSSATADTTVVAPPTLSAVSPQQAVRGQTLSVTVTGSNFQTGASVGFGAGTSVTATTVGSPTSLTATVVIAPDATPGPRNVTVSNPDGGSATLTGRLHDHGRRRASSLRYEGKQRDRVGKGNTVVARRRILDGTFKVTVEAGSGARTVTQLELWTLSAAAAGTRSPPPRSGSSAPPKDSTAHSTTPATAASASPPTTDKASTCSPPTSHQASSPPASNSGPCPLADGSSATADTTVVAPPTLSAVSPQQAVRGQTLSVTVTGSNFQTGASVGFGAGTSVTATTVGSPTSLTATVVIAPDATPGPRDVTLSNPNGGSATLTAGFTITAGPAASLSLRFEGKLRDRVGKGNTLVAPDGSLDATFRVTVEAGSGARTVTQLELWSLNSSGRWDTIASTPQWILGAAAGLDSPLLNTSNGSVSFATGDGQSFYLFAADPSPSQFARAPNSGYAPPSPTAAPPSTRPFHEA